MNEELVLWEMANLSKKRTHVPVIIYIFGDKASHGPRIKFLDSYADSVGNKIELLVPLTVDKNPVIPIKHKLNIKQKDFEKVQKWVIQNYDLLMQLYRGEIDEIEAGTRQVPLED